MRVAKKSALPRGDRESRLGFGDFSKGMNNQVDESLLPLSFAKNTYNFRVNGGILKTGLGIKPCAGADGMQLTELPSPPVKVWLYKRYNFENDYIDDHIVVYCEDGLIYYKRLNEWGNTYTKLEGAYFFNMPIAVNYRLKGDDVMIFCAMTEGMLIWDGKNPVRQVMDTPSIMSMTIHYERLFATVDGSRSAVWFSDDLDPSNWNVSMTEGGFIEMIDERGDLIKVVSFLDYLYVFRQYGITRITAYGDQSQFQVTQLYTGSGKIFGDTVTVCGDRIMFLASDGIHVFDGINARKVYGQFEGKWGKNEMAVGAFHNGKFYLACKMNYGDGKLVNGLNDAAHNNTILEIDVSTNEVNVTRGLNVCSFYSCRSNYLNKLLVVLSQYKYGKYVGELEENGKAYQEPLEKAWLSSMNNFGSPDKNKIIKSMTLLNKFDSEICIKNETEEKIFKISGKSELQKIKINMKGKRFSFEFRTDNADAYISNPTFQVITR